MAGERTRGMRTPAMVAALLALLGLAAPAPAKALDWHRCRDFEMPSCTTVRVPLDRTGELPGTLPLRVARVGSDRGRPTLMYLSGGPGSAGVEELLGVLYSVPELADRYRLIGFDQRGTGRSGLLRCPAVERDPRLRSSIAAGDCAQRIGLARRRFTTADSVGDMEAIRQALGVERLTLFGISYGTELALAYAREHPGRVERMALDSVVDPDDRDPFGLAGFRAIGPTLAALCPRRCGGVSADPAGDLAALVDRLARRPMHGSVYDARGRHHRASLGPTALADLLFDADYNPPLRAGIPAAVRAALKHHDAAPLLRLTGEGEGLADLPSPRSFSSARYATVCEETPLPWDPGTPMQDRLSVATQRAAALGPQAFLPFDFRTAAADEIRLCLRWPDVPASGSRPWTGSAYPAVPTLILQGGEDLRTPPETSARVAEAIPGAQRVVVPGVGHTVVGADPSGCGPRALRRFLAGADIGDGRCERVPTGVPSVPVPPAKLASVRPLPGLSGRVGRTAAAVGLTIRDLTFALSPAFLAYSGGGLRGGSFAIHGGRLYLRRYQAVRGVGVSGITGGGPLRLRVSGSRAAQGRVRVSGGGVLRGRLGGRRVAVRLPQSPPSGGVAMARVGRDPVARVSAQRRLVPSRGR